MTAPITMGKSHVRTRKLGEKASLKVISFWSAKCQGRRKGGKKNKEMGVKEKEAIRRVRLRSAHQISTKPQRRHELTLKGHGRKMDSGFSRGFNTARCGTIACLYSTS